MNQVRLKGGRRFLVAASVLTLSCSCANPSKASWLGDNASWIESLKCRDVFAHGKMDSENGHKFGLWFMGFMQGASTVPPAGKLPTSVGDSMTAVAIYCDKNPNILILQAATDFMSFEYNLAHAADGHAAEIVRPDRTLGSLAAATRSTT